MKIFLILTTIILLLNFSSSEITGEATINEFEINISVGYPFDFNLISPQNGTYITNEITIEYHLGNIETVLMNVNDEFNITLNGTTTIFLQNGTNILNFYLIRNNQSFEIERNITINLDKFKIIYNNYKNQGETTKFWKKPFEYYNNFENVTLENEFGAINFLEKISLIDDLINNDNILNIDANSYIIHKEIYINETQLPNFNKKAIIKFYNITFENPKIQKNNQDCLNECEFISYQNNIITFEVEGFSKYSISETQSPSRNSGGGGKNIFTSAEEYNIFEINETEIQTKIKQEQYKDYFIKIKNNINEIIEIETETSNLETFLEIDKQIILNPYEEKEIHIRIISPLHELPQSHLGEIIFKSRKTTEKILILIDIQSKNSLFDTQFKILNNKNIYPNSILITRSEILNLGETDKVDAYLTYEIKDLNEEIYFSTSKTFAIITRIETIQEFTIPENIKPGLYIMSLTVNYDNQTATASESFIVKNKTWNYYLIIILIIVFLLILYKTFFQRNKKHHKSKKSKSRGK